MENTKKPAAGVQSLPADLNPRAAQVLADVVETYTTQR